MPALHDIVTKGSVDRSVSLEIWDSTDGTPETGVVFNTSGIDLWYRREGAAKVSITEVTLAALTTAHTDGGFLHVSDGLYRLDLPDAAFATGANYVDVGGTVTGMVIGKIRVRLVDYSLEETIPSGVWGAALTTAGTAGTAGWRLAATSGLDFSGTAQGGAANSITLAAGATANNVFDPGLVLIVSGTGAGQCRPVLDYNTTTKVVTVDRSWKVNPDATSVYMMLPPPESLHTNEGIATGGAATTITLNATASATNNAYLGQTIHIVGGTGADQAAVVTAYVGATKVATVSPSWVTTPDTTSIYKVLPTGISYAAGGSITSVTGSVGSVTGAVGSVTGAVGSVTGAVGSVATGGITAASIATDAIGAAELASDAVTEIATAVWALATRTLTANTNLNDLNAAGVRAALGMASANLDTQLTTIDDFLDTEVAAIKAKTDSLTFTVAGQVDANVQSINDITITGNGQVGTEFGV